MAPTREGSTASVPEEREPRGLVQRDERWVSETEQLIEQVRQSGDAVAVEQPGDRAQQVAEQVARARLGRDVQVDRVEVDDQAQHVEVEGAGVQLQDLAAVGR